MNENPHQFGLLGLLPVVRMTDRDLNTLALGTDLTTLGLNLNSTEMLYSSFASPFSDTPASRDPYHMPESYTVSPMTPPAHMLVLVSDDTLLHSFYTAPKDMLQVYCARELYKRGWRFHKELQVSKETTRFFAFRFLKKKKKLLFSLPGVFIRDGC